MKGYLERGAGILLPITSLPSPYGIGTFGDESYRFVDQLVIARQKYWQVLPLGPTGFGDSPYAAFSAFAGNPYYIDLEYLIDEGLIAREFIESFEWQTEEDKVDYSIIYQHRFDVLREAYKNSAHKGSPVYVTFLQENKYWIDDYALYMSCKSYFDNLSWLEWDEDIRGRRPKALKKYTELLKDDIDFWKFTQFKFYEQWNKLKEYAAEKNIKIVGDIPIYVALDSADVWANTGLFQLDTDLRPKKVSGVPPDAFSEDGQKWGNPLYDWEALEADGFRWWKERMKSSAVLYDIIRIDHFIGIARYYAIPDEDEDARDGEWFDGPGEKLIDVIDSSIKDAKIIAEDLGVLVPAAKKLLAYSGYPGMKVLQFAFDGDRKNEHLPYNSSANSVMYGGTHDNETLVGYLKNKEQWELGYMREYLQAQNDTVEEITDKLFALAYASVSEVVIFQMQDILKLGSEARMNLPSTVGTNWMWRMKYGEFSEAHIERLRYLSDIYGR